MRLPSASARSLVNREGDPVADLDQSSPLVWRKSTSSEAGSCVEVAIKGQSVLVRDSKDTPGSTLKISIQDWRKFLNWVKDGTGG
jgi:hypothetical protein